MRLVFLVPTHCVGMPARTLRVPESRRRVSGPCVRKRSGGTRAAFTLIELLVVIAIIGVLMGLLLPAIQKVREAANRTACAHYMRQLGIALHAYNTAYEQFPPNNTRKNANTINADPWLVKLKPFIEQQYRVPLHGCPEVLYCPSERRSLKNMIHQSGVGNFGLTSFLAVMGTDTGPGQNNGVFYLDSYTTVADIPDGLSNTLLVGERPPSKSMRWGYWSGEFPEWHCAMGTRNTCEVCHSSDPECGWPAKGGAATRNNGDGTCTVLDAGQPPEGYPCHTKAPHIFRPGSLEDGCDVNHFWSLHPGGGNWVFGDGSVRFLEYKAGPTIVPALSTRAGNEIINEEF